MTLSESFMRSKIASDTSLIVTTYNNPPFLELVLKSLLRQKVMPVEIIVADDGSTDPTRQLIDRYRPLFPVPLIHSWIPDEGFRAAKSRNMAIARAVGDYIICIDGDIVVGRFFVHDHIMLRKPGFFVNGDRARFTQGATQRKLKSLNPRVHVFTPGLLRPLKFLRLPWMHRFVKGATGRRKIRSCNMSFWKSDLLKVNGFDEQFVGWGSEDVDIVFRLYNAGVQRKNAKGVAACVHLWHPHVGASFDNMDNNRAIANEAARTGRIRAQVGLDQYM